MFHRNTGASNELPCLPELLQWPLPDILGSDTRTAQIVDVPLEADANPDGGQALSGKRWHVHMTFY